MTRKEQLIQSLRDAADYLEKVCVGEQFDNIYNTTALIGWLQFEDKSALQSAIIGRGPFRKHVNSIAQERFTMRRDFGGLYIDFDIQRDLLCTKRVVTETLPAEPEKVIPETVIPAQPERTIERVEWDCPKSILKEDDEHASLPAPALVAAAETTEEEKMAATLSRPERFDPL